MKRKSFIVVHSSIIFGILFTILGSVMPISNSADAYSNAPDVSSPTPSSTSTQVPAAIVKDIKTGYFHRATASLEPMMPTHTGAANYQYRYAQALLGAGQTSKALSTIKAAIALEPKTAAYYRLMGKIYGVLAQNANIFHAMGLAKDVLAAFRTAVQLNPRDPKSLVDLAMYYIGAPNIVGGSIKKAHKIEATLFKISPVDALQVQAQEAKQANNYAKAETLLQQASRLDKTSGSLMTLAFLYIMKHDYADAFQIFRSITVKTPDNVRAWYWVGRTSDLSHSHYMEGIAALKHYIVLPERPDTAPSLAFAYLRLGDLFRLNGQKDLAHAEYTKAQKTSGAGNKEFKSELKKSLRKSQ
ncbi:MAG: hypothetical protein WCB49_00855 [Gammaproteobacteria bacterium]